MLTITNGRLIRGAEALSGSAVSVCGGIVTYAGPAEGVSLREGRVIDAGGLYLCPGFIDLHAHGAAGLDFLSADAEAALRIARVHARYGTTALFATVRSGPCEVMERAISCLADLIRSGSGAGIVGIHLEGPFLNPARAGIHPPGHLRKPDRRELRALMDLAGGCPLVVTLAPELPGASGLIEEIASRGGVPAAGHSNATLEEALESFDAGVRSVTHLFNAMSGMHHRRPGLAAAALADGRVSAELIADGVHVHPAMAKMALKLKGRDGIILVTDCVQALDAASPNFRVGDREVSVRDGAPVTEDGVLCGSVLTMSRALRNVRQWTGGRPEEVAAFATANPACLTGLAGRKGTLAPGMDADITVFDDALAVRLTVVGGTLAYAVPDFEITGK